MSATTNCGTITAGNLYINNNKGNPEINIA
jgi:hypothetical protein